jgi:hypothetical protein
VALPPGTCLRAPPNLEDQEDLPQRRLSRSSRAWPAAAARPAAGPPRVARPDDPLVNRMRTFAEAAAARLPPAGGARAVARLWSRPADGPPAGRCGCRAAWPPSTTPKPAM